MLKEIIVIAFLLFFSFGLFSQNRTKVDSLLQVWQNESLKDTTRLKALAGTHGFFVQHNPDSAILIAQVIIDMATEKKLPKFLGEAYNKWGLAKMSKGDYESAITEFEIAKRYHRENGAMKSVAGCTINMGSIYNSLGRRDEAIAAFKEGIEICTSIGEYQFRTNGIINLGVIYLDQGLNEQAATQFEEALKLLKITKNEEAEAGVYVNFGILENSRGDLKKAIEYLTRSMQLAEKYSIPSIVVFSLSQLAIVSVDLNEPEQSLKYLAKGDSLAKAVGYKRIIPDLLNTKGTALKQLNREEESLAAYQQSADLAKEMGAQSRYTRALGNVGLRYLDAKDYQKAIAIFEEIIEVAKNIGEVDKVYIHLANLGDAYHRKGDYNKALEYKLKAYELVEPLNSGLAMKELSKSLYETYEALDQPQKALEMLELHVAYRDSVDNEENKKALYIQEYKFAAEKEKTFAEERYQSQLQLEAEKQKNQRTIIWAVIGGLLFAVAFAVLLFNRLKLSQQQRKAIALARDKAEESERVKEQFLANMSHEIRTPMHAISGMVNILQRNDHPPEQEVYLNAMQTSTDNLVVILNDVLDLSKIEAGKLDIESIPYNPIKVVEHVAQVLKYKAEEKGLLLKCEIGEDVPDLVMGDPTRLNQILMNLAGNAIKFTEKGSVDILLEKEDAQLVFRVKDTGIGIPADKQQLIFNAFAQANQSTNRFYGGTGLGLNITKQLIELQNGSIELKSELNKGSSFRVKIPLVEAAENAITAEVVTEERLQAMATALKGIRILLAEDNPFNQMIAQDDLSYYIEDIHLDTVENGALAIEAFQSTAYDLILMDAQMPELNGFEATQKIRAIEAAEDRNSPIPIIAMTASLLKSEINNYLKSGMNNYIPKPYKPSELIGTIYKEVGGE